MSLNYLTKLGFDFNIELEKRAILVKDEEELNKKLKGKLFFYQAKNQAGISFYLIDNELNEKELYHLRKYLWNKNDADLLLYYENSNLDIIYIKASPDLPKEKYLIKTFVGKDIEKIKEIQKWQFESGAFWLNYQSFLDKAKKYQTIDRVLVGTLNDLKSKLYDEISVIEQDENKRQVVVQALIDRTLYIKFLEDKQIINSYFHQKYFGDEKADYKFLLENKRTQEINKLFGLVHQIFNNQLFETPEINENYLTDSVCQLIAESFNRDNKGQLRLFDFQFDVMPVELISYIYESFLSKEQKGNGIFYTPRKLAQLIVDDVIKEDKIGSILDPSCGSGMFLIVGFQRLLEIAKKQNLEPENIKDKINFRANLLSENIFGIERQRIAQRFTLFSLSLQIFEDIEAHEIKAFIEKELKEKGEVRLFENNNFYNNILFQNALSIDQPAFKDKVFDYLVGNPPFVTGKNKSEDAVAFKNEYKTDEFNAKNIIAGYQISQCFFLKIKDWSNETTRCGFVSNSSNFYDAENFQDFFYKNYSIETIYELSKVKKMLFESAKESVVSIIFNNKKDFDTIKYYPVDTGLFSEKPFELLIIQEESVIPIKQNDLISKKIRLRDFLVGNEFDRMLAEKISGLSIKLHNFILKDSEGNLKIDTGFKIWAEDARKKEYGINKNNWKKYSESEKKDILDTFIKKYISNEYSTTFNKKFLRNNKLHPFYSDKPDRFLSSLQNFDRPRTEDIYEGSKLLFTRLGNNLNCVYSNELVYFDFSTYTLKLNNENHYFLICALFNSKILNYFVNTSLRKRIIDSFPRISIEDIKNIPIPKNLDEDLVEKISALSKDLTEGKFEFAEKENELNELIYDLYELNYNERQRINDFFIKEPNKRTTKSQIENYKEAIKDYLQMYFKEIISVEEAEFSGLQIFKLNFSIEEQPAAKKVGLYLLNEIFKENPSTSVLLGQEIVIDEKVIYIARKNISKNWTETKAYEDSRYILNSLNYADE